MKISTKIMACITALSVVLAGCAAQPATQSPTQPKIETAERVFMSDRINIRVIGSGPDVVLIPGLGSPPAVYDELVAKLSPNYRLHLVHVAGFAGLNTNIEGPMFDDVTSEIERYLTGEHLENAKIIGHSMGGEMAMALSARKHVAQEIMVVDAMPFYPLYFGKQYADAMSTQTATIFSNIIKSQNDEAYRASQVLSIAKLVKSPQHRQQVLDWSVGSNRAAIAQGLYDLMTIDLRPGLAQNRAKITLLYAYDAQMGMSREVVDGLYDTGYANIPNVTKTRVDGSLHFIMFDRPQEFEAAVRQFLEH
ncbi:MAG: alpha/beta hydrolase [Pseudomonadota bacterium]